MASDFAADECAVWPENWQAVQLFASLATQWHYSGMSGVATGLDYSAVHAVFQMHSIKRKRQPELLAKLQILESEALDVMREQKR